MSTPDNKDKAADKTLALIKRTLNEHNYSYVKSIGRGGFSTVHLVVSLRYNEEFVCKVSEGAKSVAGNSEIKNLIGLGHPNIIRMYEFFHDEINELFYTILEYCPGGSLDTVIKKNGSLSPPLLFAYCSQAVAALQYCHSLNIAHRDIKPGNLLLDRNNRLKLADFGLSSIIKDRDTYSSTEFVGSRPYMSPEIVNRKEYDPFKGDVWALGVTFYQLSAGKLPWDVTGEQEMRLAISVGVMSFQLCKGSTEFFFVMKEMLRINEKKRPTIDWVAAHDFLNPSNYTGMMTNGYEALNSGRRLLKKRLVASHSFDLSNNTKDTAEKSRQRNDDGEITALLAHSDNSINTQNEFDKNKDSDDEKNISNIVKASSNVGNPENFISPVAKDFINCQNMTELNASKKKKQLFEQGIKPNTYRVYEAGRESHSMNSSINGSMNSSMNSSINSSISGSIDGEKNEVVNDGNNGSLDSQWGKKAFNFHVDLNRIPSHNGSTSSFTTGRRRGASKDGKMEGRKNPIFNAMLSVKKKRTSLNIDTFKSSEAFEDD